MSQCHDDYCSEWMVEEPEPEPGFEELRGGRPPWTVRVQWNEHDGTTCATAALYGAGRVITARDEGHYRVGDDIAARLGAARALEALGKRLLEEVEAEYA